MELFKTLLFFGGLSGGAILLMQIFNNKDNLKTIVSNLFQKKKQEEITNINTQEVSLIKKIEDSEILSIQTKEKIKEINRESNRKVIEILKTENFNDLSKKEDELWN